VDFSRVLAGPVDGAREVALRLGDRADVVLESFRAVTLAAFGLGYDDVAARNPRVVYASITGYGQQGAWRARSAYAPTIQAEAGITTITERQFGDLRNDSLSHADVQLHAAIAVLAALHDRDPHGRRPVRRRRDGRGHALDQRARARGPLGGRPRRRATDPRRDRRGVLHRA
jgi:crotonobetainyl-CoA:carnitine CoA-transferase CaiB-like acyl-CoA transferase